jgi:hypothetical protein
MAKITFAKEFELESGREVEVEINLNLINDPNYGADADGNRGIYTRILDDYDFVCREELPGDQMRELDGLVLKHIDHLMSEMCLVSEDV